MSARFGAFVTRYTDKGHRYRIWEVPVAAIEPALLQCTIYLYPSVAAAREGMATGGSGFLVVLEADGRGQREHTYAVTNAHVHDGGCGVIRLNTRDGRTDIIETQLDAWATAADDDLAVIRFEPHAGFQHTYIPSSRFLGEDCLIENWPVWPGDDVEFFGRFVGNDDRQFNKPVVRFGNVAMLADAGAAVRVHGRDQIGFLVECRSLGGFSGSPAFVRLSDNRMVVAAGADQYKSRGVIPQTMKLLGIDCAHLPFWSQARVRPNPEAEKIPDTYVETNSGIAVVIPAWRLMQLLNRDDLMKERQEIDREAIEGERAASAPIADIHTPEENGQFTKADFEQALKKVAKRLPDSGTTQTSDE